MEFDDEWGVAGSDETRVLCSQFAEFLSEKYIKACVELTNHYNRITIDSLAVITMVLLWNNDQTAIEFGNAVLKKYYHRQNKGLKKWERAELKVSIKKVDELFRKHKLEHQNIGESAPIYLAAVIEHTLGKIVNSSNVQDAIRQELGETWKILV